MEIKWHNRIVVRISLILLILTALSVSAFGWYGSSVTRKLLREETMRFTRTTVARLASALGDPITRSDQRQIETLVAAELQDERVAAITLRGVDRSILLAWEKQPDGRATEAGVTRRGSSPGGSEKIIYKNQVLGSIELAVEADAMASALRHTVTVLSLLTGGANVLVFLVLYLVLRRSLTRPIAELTSAAEKISLGQLEGAIVCRSRNELGHLTVALERLRVSMRHALKRLASSRKGLATIGVEEWKNVILERKRYGFEFLALRILVGRLSVNYRNNPTPDTLRRCIQQLIDFFQNEKNPLAQKDLNKIMEGGTI